MPFPVACAASVSDLHCRYKVEKLMEHLKLFSTRINIPRLIRVCEEFHHWKELVFLYIQYDEYDNAAMVMMNHSPVAWEHVLFKDVAVKVSSVEVYYKAISFYLEEHPDLLNDLLKVSAFCAISDAFGHPVLPHVDWWDVITHPCTNLPAATAQSRCILSFHE